MNVFEAIRIRLRYVSMKIGLFNKKKLEGIVEAARLVPSAGNRQPWRFIVVPGARRRL